jgi:hypothetical protein
MESYEEYALAHRRDVQCLASPDRLARKQALDRLSQSLNPAFFLQEAQSAVFRLFSDPIDRVREAAVLLVTQLYDFDVVSQTVSTTLPLLATRLKTEQSEEIKLSLLQLLQLVLKADVKIADYSGEVLECLRLTVSDACPDLKKAGCVAVAAVAGVFSGSRLRQNVVQTKTVVAALVQNFKHTHWRVRQASASALCILLKADNLLLDFQSEVLATLGLLVSDRHSQVRLELVRSLGVWLQCLLGLEAGVASMVDGQYILVDSEK